MADSILVRFDDELARRLRERAQQEQKSITSFISDAVVAQLDQIHRVEGIEVAAKQWMGHEHRQLGNRLADAHRAFKEQTDPWAALGAIIDCVEIISAEDAANLDRVTWQQFRYSGANNGADDAAARRLFAAERDEIAQRDWTWYLRTCESEDEAKALWVRQRRRYGIPVPSEKEM
jgi:predicted transcriptional regulator